ncbi:hypothetical protein H6G93_15375 [Nostoc sp. FACHB-973]|uniref:Uncharacterized protein n=1 Tax=Desmonostoc muscorum LEGE 12446 TaxID=1828758 RepID=A0A8J6ZSS8_DESMC|nr:hypothetical protein [Desmonostoc muscorum]MBD2516369.1 hypothetical protein [Nostoc sp. FACHB-973]MBX9256527.1 hypothetical protein [Desmonostoc muscorum CCALA 125]MCF2151011.1 hypothetical protein [Desmonostoc muscorum LEGE 12446]
MANITIDSLYLTGYDFFCACESFLDELVHQEMSFIEGGYFGNIYRYNSFSGGSFSGHSGFYNSFSGGFYGYGGYHNQSWC